MYITIVERRLRKIIEETLEDDKTKYINCFDMKFSNLKLTLCSSVSGRS